MDIPIVFKFNFIMLLLDKKVYNTSDKVLVLCEKLCCGFIQGP